MTNSTSPWSLPITASRSTNLQRRRWRGLNAVVSGTMGTLVVIAAISLGVAGPATSPVSPAAQAAPPGGAARTDDGVQQDGTQRPGRDGSDPRKGMDRQGGRGGQHR